MPHPSGQRGILAVLLLAMAAAPAAAGSGAPATAPVAKPARQATTPAAREQMADELTRLRRVAAGLPVDDEIWKMLRPDVERLLAAADTEMAAGRLYYGAERLGEARRAIMAMEYCVARPQAARDMEPFMTAWRDTDADMTAEEARLKAGGWRGSPAAIRALGEAALGQARPLYHAAREYAAADGPSSGLYNVGEARAALDFANFCRGLRFEPVTQAAAAATAPRSIASEISTLESKVRAAYVPPRSIDNHADFIRIHSTLKHAADLDAAGLRYGALHTYLKARRAFAVLEDGWAGRPVPAVAALRGPRDQDAARLAAPGRDDSIGTLHLEAADSLIERSAPATDAATDARTAAAILEDVVPAYFAALEAAAAMAPPRADALRVTLVRWPYT